MPGVWFPAPSWQALSELQIGSPPVRGGGNPPNGSGTWLWPVFTGTPSVPQYPVAPPLTSREYGGCTVKRPALFWPLSGALPLVEVARIWPPLGWRWAGALAQEDEEHFRGLFGGSASSR